MGSEQDKTKEKSQNNISQINFTFQKDSYYESQIVEGDLYFEPKTTILLSDVIMNLHIFQGWIIYDKNNNNILNEFKHDILCSIPLKIGSFFRQNSQNFQLNQETYRLPFKFQLPKNLQPSFEYPNLKNLAFIRYILEASIESTHIKENCKKFILIKSRPINIPFEEKNINETLVKSLGIFSHGKCSITLYTLNNNYKINDKIPLTVDIQNDTKYEVNLIKITIRRELEFYKNKKNYKFDCKFLRQKYDIKVAPKSKGSFHYDIQIRDSELKDFNYKKELNPYEKITDLNYLMPSIKNEIMKCEYYLKATAYFSSSVGFSSRPRIEVPIYITHQLKNEYENEKNQMNNNNNIPMNINNQFNNNNGNSLNINMPNNNNRNSLNINMTNNNNGNSLNINMPNNNSGNSLNINMANYNNRNSLNMNVPINNNQRNTLNMNMNNMQYNMNNQMNYGNYMNYNNNNIGNNSIYNQNVQYNNQNYNFQNNFNKNNNNPNLNYPTENQI